MKAYRQDFDAIATVIAGGDTSDVSRMSLGDITTDAMRTAFAQYAKTHEAGSIQRCWSTWNVLCMFLYTSELIAANPMPLVGRPKVAKTLPKALPADSVAALLAALSSESEPRRRSEWIERDRALILTGLLAGLRADELLRANVGDLRRTDHRAVIHVRGKGGPACGLFRKATPAPGTSRGGWLLFVMNWPAAAIQCLAVGFAIFGYQGPRPVWPRWVAYYNFWCAFAFAAGAVVVLFKDGVFAWNGLLAFWLVAVFFGAWFLVMTWQLLATIRTNTAESTHSADDFAAASEDNNARRDPSSSTR